MSILCGIDFSEPSQRALRVAAEFARRQNIPLHLLHALPLSKEELGAARDPELVGWSERQLQVRAATAREHGVSVSTHLTAGPPDEALLAQAAECRAELIVVGALGHRRRDHFQLGSHAERLAQRARVPVLVVRRSEPFENWLGGKGPLRVVLGADLSRSTDVAMAKVEALRQLAPCEVTAVHLYWPPQQFERLGLQGVRSFLEPDPDVTKTLVRDLTHRLSPNRDPKSLQVHVEPHLGRRGDRLAALASERGAELLVVGTHERGAIGRLWEGSVSRWALHAAETSVLCVPQAAPSGTFEVEVPRVRNVFAATDFSAAGNAAVAMAYAIAGPFATVHLAHIVPATNVESLAPHDVFALERAESSDPRRTEIHKALAALIAHDHRQVTRLYALESNEPGAAVCQAALRVEADVICVGHRGRTNLVNALLGSVAKDVLAKAELPVLLARAPQA